MAEDNNRDAKKISQRDAKREAKIEAKRRKLAEQRAERTQNAAGQGQKAGKEWYDADRQVITPISSEGGVDAGGIRPPIGAGDNEKVPAAPEAEKMVPERQVTADSKNRERHILVDQYEAGKASQDGQPPAEDAAPADEAPAGAGAGTGAGTLAGGEAADGVRASGAAAGAAVTGAATAGAGTAAKAPKESVLIKIWRLFKRFIKWLFWKIVHGLRNMTPAMAVRLLVALVVLIGLIYGALELADYYDKKTDIYVTDEGYFHADQFEQCVPLNGIDISEHQKGEIDWKKLKTSGVDFVFIRAGYRAADDGSLHADENFAKNMKAAQKAGVMTGVYFFSQALTPEEGKEEAEFVLDMVKDYDLTMPIAIDYEIYKDGRLDKKIQAGELYAASFYHDIVLGFTERVEKAGYESVVYASRDMLTNYMQEDLIDDMANIWLARYDNVANLEADYWLWQYTDEGKVGGLDEKVDQSFWYMEPNKVYKTRGKRPKKAVSVGDCRISFKRSSFKLHNFRAEPKYGITYEGKGMKEGRDYVSSVVHDSKEGTGYLIIRGIGNYKDWIMYPFTID